MRGDRTIDSPQLGWGLLFHPVASPMKATINWFPMRLRQVYIYGRFFGCSLVVPLRARARRHFWRALRKGRQMPRRHRPSWKIADANIVAVLVPSHTASRSFLLLPDKLSTEFSSAPSQFELNYAILRGFNAFTM